MQVNGACDKWQSDGTATLDNLPAVKSSTVSRPSHCGVIFSSLRIAQTCSNWGSGNKMQKHFIFDCRYHVEL